MGALGARADAAAFGALAHLVPPLIGLQVNANHGQFMAVETVRSRFRTPAVGFRYRSRRISASDILLLRHQLQVSGIGAVSDTTRVIDDQFVAARDAPSEEFVRQAMDVDRFTVDAHRGVSGLFVDVAEPQPTVAGTIESGEEAV